MAAAARAAEVGWVPQAAGEAMSMAAAVARVAAGVVVVVVAAASRAVARAVARVEAEVVAVATRAVVARAQTSWMQCSDKRSQCRASPVCT